MNDDLLRSHNSLGEPRGGKARTAVNSSQTFVSLDASPTLKEHSTAFKVLMVDRQSEINVTLNNICLILFLNLIPFSMVISSLINPNWFIMANAPNYEYWVNFVTLEKKCQTLTPTTSPTPVPLCTGSSSVYSYLMMQFYLQGCPAGPETVGDPSNLCSVLTSYAYTGLVATVTTALGLLLHLIYMYQLLRISWNRDDARLKGFSPLTIACFAIFFYFGSMIYWFFASATLINDNSPLALPARFGSAAFCYLGAAIVFILLAFWAQSVYRKGKHKSLVTDLLKAEKKYVDQVHRGSDLEITSSTIQDL